MVKTKTKILETAFGVVKIIDTTKYGKTTCQTAYIPHIKQKKPIYQPSQNHCNKKKRLPRRRG